MSVLFALAALVAGILNTVQSGANATLGKTLQAPMLTAFVVAIGNMAVYAIVSLVIGFALPSPGKIIQVPWWAWLGGSLGAVYVLAVIFLAQKLGAAIFTGSTVTAAILTSVLLDHFGWVGFAQHSASLWRIAGCILMIGGLALVSAF